MLDNVLLIISNAGWIWNLKFDPTEGFTLSICHPGWITNSPYNSVPLPTWKGQSMSKVVSDAYEFIQKDQ